MPEVTSLTLDPSTEVPFDFRQSSQIPETQLEAIRALHETFVHHLCESLSLTLRVEVTGTIAGLEQTTYGELAENLAAPACLLYFTMQPQEGSTLVDVSPSLVAPILDCVLGGNGKIVFPLEREITDIEQAMLEEFFGILAHELREVWKPVSAIDFQFASVETTPQVTQRFAAGDPVILIAADLRLGENEGRVSVAIPAFTLKLLRQKFESRSETRKPASRDKEQAVLEKLATGLKLDLDCTLQGSNIRLCDLLKLKTGDVIDTGIACDSPVTILVNGVPKFSGDVTVEGATQAVVLRVASASAL
ncbi:MAG TPA: FliM/FliN family flagellar motor switch protein [Bryobacteraceae bacterium]|jgi:flagellar motor switch protein FliM|nr:FliM/FliN family flagellar motor switch protein [Bryobacteraceae bacterium]